MQNKKLKSNGEGKVVRVLSIVDSGQDSGLGHLKRTRNLVNSLESKKGTIKSTYLLDKDYDQRIFPINEEFLTVDFHNSAGISQAILRLCPHPDFLIVDSYKIEERCLNELLEKHATSVSLLIDDSNRFQRYACDFILNFNPTAESLNYKTTSDLQKLFGLQYFPLSNALREARTKSRYRKVVKNVLVTMGGADPENLTESICRGFSQGFDDITFHIVLGPQFKNSRRILNEYKSEVNYRFYQNRKDLSDLMVKCDLAICAASTTAYELAYLGKPAILVQNFKNQTLNLKFFKEHFSFPYLGLHSIKKESRLVGNLKNLFADFIVDEKLREKIFRASRGVFNTRPNQLMLKLLERLKAKKVNGS